MSVKKNILAWLAGGWIAVGAFAGDYIPATARFVEVHKLNSPSIPLHISEIEVFEFGTTPDEVDDDGTSQNDLVQAGSPSVEIPPTTTQLHSVHGGTQHSFVYDGDLEGGALVWTTDEDLGEDSRYMLDLGVSYPIDLVRIWGRLDGAAMERLENFRVTLYEDSGAGLPGAVVSSVLYESTAPSAADGPVELSLAVFSPTLEYFTVDHNVIGAGEPVVFSWKVNPEFSSVVIDGGIGDVSSLTGPDGEGSFTLPNGPDMDTTYTFTVVRNGETVQVSQVVTLTDQPKIRSFDLAPALSEPGGAVQLSWQLVNASSVSLNGADVSGLTETTVYPVRSTRYELRVANAFGEVVQYRDVTVVAPGEAVINEFMAANDGGHLDEDLDSSDWIELSNPMNVTANLNGCYLTDDPDELTKWRLPNVSLAPGGHLVVFASGKNRAVAGSELHANFSLNADGEYLALVKPDGVTVISEYFPEFSKQKSGVSFGFAHDFSMRGYLLEPTPGVSNEVAYLGFVKDTLFDVDRGFYDTPVQVSIHTDTEGGMIRYTLDGSIPSEESGILLNGPIQIDQTTVLRAVAFKPGYVPSNVDTHTYIFRNDVITSPVMDTGITQDSVYGPQLRDSLIAIPSISLVFEGDILRSEKPCSVELIGFEDGNVQEDCGMARYGNYITNFEKRNMRLYFRNEYGASKLDYPLFEGFDSGVQPVRKFDRLDLRAGGHDMWQRGFYMSNRFVDDTLLEMGHLSTHGRYVHVYVNGTYWGQYHLRERWGAAMHAEYLGGEKEDYEAIASNRGGNDYSDGTAYDGDGSAWERVKSLAGNFYAVTPYLNVTNQIDFALTALCGRAEQEARLVGPVVAGSGFLHQMNDGDGFTRSSKSEDRIVHVLNGVDDVLGQLRTEGHPDFEMLMADRIHKHFFNDGALTPDLNRARLNAWGTVLEQSIIAEVARWKNMKINADFSNYSFQTPDDWKNKKNAYYNNMLPGLTATVLGRIRQDGLYPSVEAPEFNQHGGIVAEGFSLYINGSGMVYYTLDGSDPRLPGGAVAPGTQQIDAGAGGLQTLISRGAVWSYLDNGSNQGTLWRNESFNDVSWKTGPAELGYGDGGEEATVVSFGPDENNKYVTTYFRHTVSNVQDVAGVAALTINLRADDGAVVYLNGVEVIRDGMPAGGITYQTYSTATIGGASESTYDQFSVDPSLLQNGDNLIAVEVHQRSATSSDISFDMDLIAERAGSLQAAIALNEDTVVKARAKSGNVWSALTEASFVIEGREAASVDNLVITEVHYNPDGSDDFEFIELLNLSGSRLDLSGVRGVSGVHFICPDGASLPPYGYGVVVRDSEQFEVRYGDPGSPWYYPGIQILAAWPVSEGLSNGGELITLQSANGSNLVSFTYDDGGEWPGRADGKGGSLELIDPSASWGAGSAKRSYFENPARWRSSSEYHGTPGRAGSSPMVVISEILAHSDLGEDWIELHNTGSQPLNIGGWFLCDSRTNLLQYSIPPGTQIAAGGYYTFWESELGFAFSELGDDAILTIHSGTNLLTMVDSVEFEASNREMPFGRYVRSDGKSDFPTLRSKTIGENNVYPLVGPLVISEVMVDPLDGPEFVELVNMSDAPVALFEASSPTSTWKLASAVDYSFPQGQVIPSQGVVIVSGLTPAGFRAERPDVSDDVLVFGPWEGALDNQGESVKLYSPGIPEPNGSVPYVLADRVKYFNDTPWPVAADGSGRSLERIGLYLYGNDPANWRISEFAGGTPGWMTGSERHMLLDGAALSRGGQLSWSGIPAQRYRVEYCDNLTDDFWKELPVLVASSNQVMMTDSSVVTNAARFYRVRWVE